MPTIPQQYVVSDLRTALSQRLFPTVTVWNRLEGRPRSANFDRALKAEVRDALWMLTKQWQIGEFFADDAGSPIFAKARVRTSEVTKYQAAGGATEEFQPNIPLEAKAEQRVVEWIWNGQKMRLDLRAQLGRQWRKLLDVALLPAYHSKYLAQYPIQLLPRDAKGDYVYAHRRGWQQYAALAGRSVDGGDLYLYLSSDPGHRASDGVTLNDPNDKKTLDDLGTEFLKWFAAQYYQPAQEAAWKPEYLEYQFACSAPQNGSDFVLEAEEYSQGRIDWYSFDRASLPEGLGGPAAPPTAEQVIINSFIPTPVTFQGMPDPRWWALEDRKTDFGSVTPATTDLAQLLLMEFGLVYANDWFLVPFRIPAGTLALVEGLAVTNNFGERFWVIAAGTGAEDNWHRWAMFEINSENAGRSLADTSLLIPPSSSSIMEGDPLEEIELARDEVANMVWAIERNIPSVAGPGRAGKDEARETLQYQQQLIAPVAAPPAFAANIAYLAMTSVPEHWIPFMPVHVPGSIREIQLQRSRMLRIMQGDPNPPVKVPPRSTLMRQGLDNSPAQTYFLHEEEVPRAGITVTESFRRTRWTSGEAYVWLGVQKQTGRGERSSGLAFDAIANAKPNPT
jgi:hypothetical protein